MLGDRSLRTRHAYRGRERGDVVGAVVAAAVDEEGRRTGDAAQVGAVDIFGDAGSAGVLLQLVGEPLDVEAELARRSGRGRRAEGVLVVEQEVVHLPERSLLGRGLGGFRGQLGARVDVAQRQVPPHVADVAEVAEQLADDRFRLPAVRTLEVAVLDKRDRRLERPANVVPLRIDSL